MDFSSFDHRQREWNLNVDMIVVIVGLEENFPISIIDSFSCRAE